MQPWLFICPNNKNWQPKGKTVRWHKDKADGQREIQLNHLGQTINQYELKRKI